MIRRSDVTVIDTRSNGPLIDTRSNDPLDGRPGAPSGGPSGGPANGSGPAGRAPVPPPAPRR